MPLSPPKTWIEKRRKSGQWGLIIGLSLLFTAPLEALHLPAALLLGPMAAAIFLATEGARIRVASLPYRLAQAVVGCLIARSVPVSAFGDIARNGPVFFAGVVSAILLAAVLGYLMARFKVLPGTTAVWGSSPGAATTMVIMAEAYGADVRLVAFMQYLRVVCVVLAATFVSSLWTHVAAPPAVVWFPHLALGHFAITLALVVCCPLLAQKLRLPAGAMLLPMAAGILLQEIGLKIELPPWLLAPAYALIGWSIGLRFTRTILGHAVRALPWILGSIAILIALCGLIAAFMVYAIGIDPLTAYLASCPGGVDSVAIIAASSAVDMPFVMAMQTVRLILVIATGPALARFIANRI